MSVSVSQATVRKVVCGEATLFKYNHGVQPAPNLGAWLAILTGILAAEAKLPRGKRRSTQRLPEELRGHGYDGNVRRHGNGQCLRLIPAQPPYGA